MNYRNGYDEEFDHLSKSPFESKFWMIFCTKGSSPTQPHQTREAAEIEADRLARKHLVQN